MLNYHRINRVHLSRCFTRENETPVQPGLAVTPSQMFDMMQRGVPVSTANLGLTYDDGVSELDFAPTMENGRYPDMNAMWEAQQEIKAKAKKAYNPSVFNQQTD